MKNFDFEKQNDILKSEKPIVLKFTGSWCSSCQSLSEQLDSIIPDYEDNIDFFTVSLDLPEGKDFARKFRIMSLPVLMFRKNGEEVERLVGTQSTSDIVTLLNDIK